MSLETPIEALYLLATAGGYVERSLQLTVTNVRVIQRHSSQNLIGAATLRCM